MASDDTPLCSELRIVNRLGLHARAAAKFVRTAMRFKAEVTLSKNGDTVNGKSIMGILTLAAGLGTTIVLEVRGEDQKEAFAALKTLVEDGFGEK